MTVFDPNHEQTPCTCPMAGYCKTHQRQMRADHWAMCHGYVRYYHAFADKHESDVFAGNPNLPGNMLHAALEKVGFRTTENCQCMARVRKMNRKGKQWCIDNLETIIGWLHQEARVRKMPFSSFGARLLVKRILMESE